MILSKNFDESFTIHNLTEQELTCIKNALMFFQKNTENDEAKTVLSDLTNQDCNSHLSVKLREGLAESRNWQH